MEKTFSVDGNAMNTDQILNTIEGLFKFDNCSVTIHVNTTVGKVEK